MAADLADRLDGIVHEPTQVHDRGVDLTLSEVYTVENPGRVDFGGGELADPEIEPHGTVLRNPDDDYRWWHLNGGQYLVTYNEELRGDDPVRLQTREELRERGTFHPTLSATELGRMPLSAPSGGIRLKENARISTLLPDW
jgi:hypothetical protein